MISRSSGRSATGAAAYRAGVKVKDDRTGLVHDYSRKTGVDCSVILSPENAPSWTHDRAQLWNQVEQVEKRKDSQLCREVEVALPRELSSEQMQKLVTSFAQNQFVEKGMIVDVNIHHAKGDNPHAHILLTTREITPDGFGKKNRDWNRKELLKEWREAWEVHANKTLKMAGREEKIDHRTLEAQGVERLPQIHLGAKVVEMEQRGQRTERGERALDIEQSNTRIKELQDYREAISHERDIQIAESSECGRVSSRDRAISASPSDADGRDSTGLERPTGSQQTTSRRLESGADRDSGSVAGGRERDEGVRGEPARGIAGGEASLKRMEMAVMGRDSGGLHDAYSGAFDRIVDLARTSGCDAARRRVVCDEAQRPVERTYQAAKRQLEAMGCRDFEVGIRSDKGQMMTRTWSSDEVLKSLPWLKRENAKGADIFVRPAGEKNQGLILVDDLSQTQLGRMKTAGLAPAAVIETSPRNYQAWVRLTKYPLAPDVATTASREIATRFQGDINSADWRHFGRLAGFTNRKPEHTTKTGLNPWVLCHESSGKQASKGAEMAQEADRLVIDQRVEVERRRRTESPQRLSERFLGGDPVREHQRQLKLLTERYGASMDASKADYMICSDMAKRGYSSDQLMKALKEASPELCIRKAGHEDDYCQPTVQAVMNDVGNVKEGNVRDVSEQAKPLSQEKGPETEVE